MASVVDILETRLSISGVEAYQSGLDRSAGALAKWGAVAAGAAAIANRTGNIIRDSLQEAISDQTAFNRAVGNFKGATSIDDVKEFASTLQDLTTVPDDKIADIFGILGTFEINPGDAKGLTREILNSAQALKAAGVSGEGLSTAVGKAIQGGNLSGLQRMGIYVDKVAFSGNRAQAVMDALRKQGGDAAAAFAKTPEGKLAAFDRAVEDLKGTLGEGFVPALNIAVETGTKFLRFVNQIPGGVSAAAAIIGGAYVASVGLAQASTWALIAELRTLTKAHQEAGAAALQHGAAESTASNAGAGSWLKNLGPKAMQLAKSPLALAAGAAIGTVVGGGLAQKAIGADPAEVGPGAGLRKFAMDFTGLSKPKAAETTKAETPQDKTNQLLSEQNDLLRKIAAGAPTDYAGLSVRHQFGALELGTLIS